MARNEYKNVKRLGQTSTHDLLDCRARQQQQRQGPKTTPKTSRCKMPGSLSARLKSGTLLHLHRGKHVLHHLSSVMDHHLATWHDRNSGPQRCPRYRFPSSRQASSRHPL